MEHILKDFGLSALIQKFKEERIDEKVTLLLSDSELNPTWCGYNRGQSSFSRFMQERRQLQEMQVQVLVALGLIQIEQPKQELD